MKKTLLLLAALFWMINVQGATLTTQTLPYPNTWVWLPNGMAMTLQQMIDNYEIAVLISDIKITPNPVRHNQIASVSFHVPVPMDVKIVITNMQGKTILVKNLGKRDAGNYTERLSASDLTNGMHNYTFVTKHGRVSERFVVAR